MSFTPFNAPLLSGLLGDMEMAAHFSVAAELDAAIRIEIALAKACADAGLISQEAATAIETCAFEPDVKALNAASARDGVYVPEFVKQFRARVGEPHSTTLHVGATSQDVVDTSLMMRLKKANSLLVDRCETIGGALDTLIHTYGDQPLMGRTRMQQALPITVSDRLDSWRRPVKSSTANLTAAQDQFPLQLGGPVGTRDTFGIHADEICAAMADALGLADAPAWHTDRSALCDFVHELTKLTTALGKMGQDIALMAQNEIAEIKLSGAGGSSAMPHKQNPVLAESLVTLACFNASLAGGFNHSALHEQERSGSNWTLEWMLLPQICVAAGAATRNAIQLLGSIEFLGKQQ
ncbi:MAG: 3-carboxy-cis,cis-muconate cycloisomerase [Pseudomonadota bacterium]